MTDSELIALMLTIISTAIASANLLLKLFAVLIELFDKRYKSK